VFLQNTAIYADGPEITFFVTRSAVFGEGLAHMSVSGYLIDCSVAACN